MTKTNYTNYIVYFQNSKGSTEFYVIFSSSAQRAVKHVKSISKDLTVTSVAVFEDSTVADSLVF